MTSLIYLPVYLLCKIDWKKRKNMAILILLIILAIPAYFFVMNHTKYVKYLTAGSIYHQNKFLIIEIILSGVILFLATLEKKHVEVEKEYFYIYYILQIITFALALFSKFLPVADRLVWLFFGQNILFIPLIIKNVKKAEQKMLLTICLIIMMSITVYCQTMVKDSFDVIPYKTIFEK